MTLESLPSSVKEPETSEASEVSSTDDEIWQRLDQLHQLSDEMNEHTPDEWNAAHPEGLGYWREMQEISIEVNRLDDVLKSRERDAQAQASAERKAGGAGIRFFTFRH